MHRRIAPGCSFIADHVGCHLTFPTFSIHIDDRADCTVECTGPLSQTLDFDARLHHHPTVSRATAIRETARRVATTSASRYRACLASSDTTQPTPLRKSRSHLHDPAIEGNIESDPTLPTNVLPLKLSDTPIRPVYSVNESGTAAIERISESELQRLFGSRKLANWKLLEQVGTGLHVVHDSDPPLTIGDMTTINRNRSGRLLDRPKARLHTVGMDIGYGDGTSPGGYRYALTLVDLATRHTWTYGLKTKSHRCVIDALWSFFIDAGGLPQRI